MAFRELNGDELQEVREFHERIERALQEAREAQLFEGTRSLPHVSKTISDLGRFGKEVYDFLLRLPESELGRLFSTLGTGAVDVGSKVFSLLRSGGSSAVDLVNYFISSQGSSEKAEESAHRTRDGETRSLPHVSETVSDLGRFGKEVYDFLLRLPESELGRLFSTLGTGVVDVGSKVFSLLRSGGSSAVDLVNYFISSQGSSGEGEERAHRTRDGEGDGETPRGGTQGSPPVGSPRVGDKVTGDKSQSAPPVGDPRVTDTPDPRVGDKVTGDHVTGDKQRLREKRRQAYEAQKEKILGELLVKDGLTPDEASIFEPIRERVLNPLASQEELERFSRLREFSKPPFVLSEKEREELDALSKREPIAESALSLKERDVYKKFIAERERVKQLYSDKDGKPLTGQALIDAQAAEAARIPQDFLNKMHVLSQNRLADYYEDREHQDIPSLKREDLTKESKAHKERVFKTLKDAEADTESHKPKKGETLEDAWRRRVKKAQDPLYKELVDEYIKEVDREFSTRTIPDLFASHLKRGTALGGSYQNQANLLKDYHEEAKRRGILERKLLSLRQAEDLIKSVSNEAERENARLLNLSSQAANEAEIERDHRNKLNEDEYNLNIQKENQLESALKNQYAVRRDMVPPDTMSRERTIHRGVMRDMKPVTPSPSPTFSPPQPSQPVKTTFDPGFREKEFRSGNNLQGFSDLLSAAGMGLNILNSNKDGGEISGARGGRHIKRGLDAFSLSHLSRPTRGAKGHDPLGDFRQSLGTALGFARESVDREEAARAALLESIEKSQDLARREAEAREFDLQKLMLVEEGKNRRLADQLDARRVGTRGDQSRGDQSRGVDGTRASRLPVSHKSLSDLESQSEAHERGLDLVAKMRSLIPKVTGSIGPLAGYRPQIFAPAERQQYEAMSNELVGTLTKDLKGAMSDKDLLFLKSRVPGLHTSPKAALLILQDFEDTYRKALKKIEKKRNALLDPPVGDTSLSDPPVGAPPRGGTSGMSASGTGALSGLSLSELKSLRAKLAG